MISNYFQTYYFKCNVNINHVTVVFYDLVTNEFGLQLFVISIINYTDTFN